MTESTDLMLITVRATNKKLGAATVAAPLFLPKKQKKRENL